MLDLQIARYAVNIFYMENILALDCGNYSFQILKIKDYSYDSYLLSIYKLNDSKEIQKRVGHYCITDESHIALLENSPKPDEATQKNILMKITNSGKKLPSLDFPDAAVALQTINSYFESSELKKKFLVEQSSKINFSNKVL